MGDTNLHQCSVTLLLAPPMPRCQLDLKDACVLFLVSATSTARTRTGNCAAYEGLPAAPSQNSNSRKSQHAKSDAARAGGPLRVVLPPDNNISWAQARLKKRLLQRKPMVDD